MSSKFKYLILVLFALNVSFSQNKDEVLLTVDGDPILTSEFLRVYNKNLDLVKDESQKDIDGYLKLFTEYQLKLKEARRLKLDEDKSYKREFSSYKNQLLKNYLSENKVTDALIEEAYHRSNEDINASHILVRLDESEKDTLNAYNEVLALRANALKEGFARVKAEFHNGKTIFVEDLGYFSAFKMVYDFETAAYNTPVGEFSMPFRTQFGYHVVKVNDRRKSQGTLTAAHIMVALNQADSLLDSKQRIDDIYKKLNQGESFEALAKQFSDDKSTAKNGGELSPFKSGQLGSETFESKAFNLENNGDISAPFKTEYGWHIVKRISLKPNEDFEDVKSALETKVKRDSRSKLINEAMVKELKNRYNISSYPEAKTYFENLITKDFFERSWTLPENLETEKPVFKINNKIYTYQDFGKHLTNAQRIYSGKSLPIATVVDTELESFFEKSILQFREDNLENENEAYANILKEYRDGLLLFDLMEKEIWNKASKDSIGLEAFYARNKSNYHWNERVEVIMASSADEAMVKTAQDMMQNEKSEDEIKKALNTEELQNIIFTSGTFTLDNPKLPANFEVKQGISELYEHNEAFHVINVKAILPSGPKTLEEARGAVINDYQIELEAKWINDLHKRYKVDINKKALKAIKAKI